ncbi:MAG: hypothetical protein LUE99_02670 [Bacteroides sp.]|nr:hypothetical protein [Bacteroides sp.]
MKRLRKIIGALALLVLFVGYEASVTAFTHVHYVNGVLVAHSHPFHGKHTHTKSELIVIGCLATFHSPEIDVHEDLHPMRVLLRVMETPAVTPALKGESVRGLSLRAPPVFAA